MIRVDVDDRLDTMGSTMAFEIWHNLDDWFLDAAPALKWAIQEAVEG